ncbi:MAG TPA: AbrB/MazE/SpoVT family DNA-binding domain-containing protein [Caldilineaceae bacterium]|nr:AbrB/MazE/SpoVT family DNA-binding domain-containing protein [Caldilineaceae bacterium]
MKISPDIILEQPGIIAISENLRKQLGLTPGMALLVEAANGGVRLRVKERSPRLTYENRVLVFTGGLTDSNTDFVEQDREQRMTALMQ